MERHRHHVEEHRKREAAERTKQLLELSASLRGDSDDDDDDELYDILDAYEEPDPTTPNTSGCQYFPLTIRLNISLQPLWNLSTGGLVFLTVGIRVI